MIELISRYLLKQVYLQKMPEFKYSGFFKKKKDCVMQSLDSSYLPNLAINAAIASSMLGSFFFAGFGLL